MAKKSKKISAEEKGGSARLQSHPKFIVFFCVVARLVEGRGKLYLRHRKPTVLFP